MKPTEKWLILLTICNTMNTQKLNVVNWLHFIVTKFGNIKKAYYLCIRIKNNNIINTKINKIMNASQMQNKYDIIANEIEIDDVKMFNEDGNGTHTPSVYEYVKHAINNEEGFLAWLFDDGDIESNYDLDEEQQEELEEFIEFCIPDNER